MVEHTGARLSHRQEHHPCGTPAIRVGALAPSGPNGTQPARLFSSAWSTSALEGRDAMHNPSALRHAQPWSLERAITASVGNSSRAGVNDTCIASRIIEWPTCQGWLNLEGNKTMVKPKTCIRAFKSIRHIVIRSAIRNFVFQRYFSRVEPDVYRMCTGGTHLY